MAYVGAGAGMAYGVPRGPLFAGRFAPGGGVVGSSSKCSN